MEHKEMNMAIAKGITLPNGQIYVFSGGGAVD